MTQLTPESAPQLLETEQPIYFAGGLSYDAARNEGVSNFITSQGYDITPVLPDPNFRYADPGFAMTVNGVSEDVSRRQAMRKASRPEVEVSISKFQQSRANELVGMIGREGYSQVNAIFQSADAQNGLLAASQHPELFNDIILAYPAGIVRQPNPFRAIPRTVFGAAKSKRLVHRLTQERFNFEDLDVRARAKNFGGFVVASSVALSQQTDLLHQMRSKENSPGVSLVLGADDAMISPKRVLGSLTSPKDVDFILITDTPHGINGRDYILKDILGLFPKMEELRRRRQEGDPTAAHLVERLIFPKNFSPYRALWIEEAARRVERRANSDQVTV